MFVSVLVTIISQKILKGKTDNRHAITIIRWILLGYGTLVLFYYLIILFMPESSAATNSAFWSWATAPYKYYYWFMLAANAFLPLVLYLERVQHKVYFILGVTIVMNIGWLMESFIIHITSLHRDYVHSTSNFYLPYNHELIILLRGFLTGVAIMLISVLMTKKRYHIKP